MVPVFQIAGLFTAITAALVFTAWAETWLASTAAPINRRRLDVERSVAREFADPSEGDVNRAA